MKLDELKIKNFRGYQNETTISISDLTAFIGKNDAGKSTILEALEIFFNNTVVICEKDDLNIFTEDKNIEISCVFTQIPEDIVIDTSHPTKLADEYLLNDESKLEIKKIFTASTAKPKEKVYVCCVHPSVPDGNDLLTLKRSDLTKRACSLGISEQQYQGNINSSIRKAIWSSFDGLDLQYQELLVDKEDTKKVYEYIKKYLPIFALFQSDRQSRDDDKEVTDPMKIAVRKALQEVEEELQGIKEHVRKKAIETGASRFYSE